MKGALIDVDYITKNEKPIIRLVFKGKRFYKIYDDSFEPYFYLDADDLKEARSAVEKITINAKGKQIKVKRMEAVKKNVLGEEREILKIICNHPRDVPILREELRKIGAIYEHNIPFARAYIKNKGLVPLEIIEFEREGRFLKKIIKIHENPELKLRMLAFDTEVYNPLGVPRQDKDPLIMISYADEEQGVLTYKKIGKKFVHTHKDEEEIINTFCDLVKKKDVELLIGYNSSQFDLPYLKARAKQLGIPLPLGRDGSSFKLSTRGIVTRAKIVGRLHIDLYNIIVFLGIIGALKSFRYTLGEAYSEIVGKEKKEVKKLEIWRLWDEEKGLEPLAEYSLHDAVAAKELADQLLPMEVELSKLVKVPLFDVCGAMTGNLVEQLLMNKAHWENVIVPNTPKEEEINKRRANPIVGAFVKVPEPGIYENIAVFDFRSLYPSIIISYNIDPFTLNCKCCSEKEAFVSPAGYKFCAKKKGLIPKVLEELLVRRMEIKKKMKSYEQNTREYKMLATRQQALKILLNSFYGYLAYPRSRWYSREAGESTTAWGRQYIQETMKEAEKEGFKVLYGDTDALFMLLGDKVKKDALEFMKRINAKLPEKMELELEDFYTRGVFVSKKLSKEEAVGAKKKYALLSESGRIKIRGFELVRRDWAKIAKDTQEKVLETILREGSKDKAMKVVIDVIDNLKNNKVKLEDLVIYTRLKKSLKKYELISPEVAAAQKAKAAGIPLEEGSVVEYVITKKGKSISEKAELAELAKDYDPDYYIEHQVIPAVLKILKELGVSEDDLLFKGKQSTLNGW